jgi:pyruvate dehydrogenase complex dehydrogenase (E1) component
MQSFARVSGSASKNCFRGFGWDVAILKYGSPLEPAFREPRGETVRRWIDRCPNQLYSALVFQGGAAWRKQISEDIGAQSSVAKLIESRSDAELAQLMTNLAGHNLPTLLKAFGQIDHDRPVCFICYTIKGYGLPLAGHKHNHAGLMTPAQMKSYGAYWLREPGPNCQVIVAYTGAVAPEAIQAVGLMAEDRRDVGLLAVTSADRLNAGWSAAMRARERGLVQARSHIERLFAGLPTHCGIVTDSTAIQPRSPGSEP